MRAPQIENTTTQEDAALALLKKGDKEALKNYRPVSLLAVAGKILEKVVALQIEEFFEMNKLLGKFQFGFQKIKSTISELLTLFDTLLEALKSLRHPHRT